MQELVYIKSQASFKVDGGKYLKVELGFDDHIRKCLFSGDFFLIPSKLIFDIENLFVDVNINFDQFIMESKIVALLEKEGAELVGLEASDLVKCINRALCNGD